MEPTVIGPIPIASSLSTKLLDITEVLCVKEKFPYPGITVDENTVWIDMDDRRGSDLSFESSQ